MPAWSSVYQIQFVIGLIVMVAVLLLVRHQQANPNGGGRAGRFLCTAAHARLAAPDTCLCLLWIHVFTGAGFPNH